MRGEVCCVLLAAALIAGPTAMAQVQKGMEAYDMGDYETAMAECLPAAEAGDPIGQFCIGRMYANGFGVAMDDALALQWYGMAAEQGHAEALYNLGVMHANGWGVPMDDAAAAEFFTKAAELGSALAQMSLANLCQSGRGIERDIVAAYKWYAIADELGHMSAYFKLDELAPELTEEERLLAEESAAAWLASDIGARALAEVMD